MGSQSINERKERVRVKVLMEDKLSYFSGEKGTGISFQSGAC